MKYFENFGHSCTVKYDEQLENFLNNLSWLQRLTTIDTSSPSTSEFYNSHCAIITAMKNHLTSHPFTIHPFSRLKFYIECYMAVIFCCGLIYAPFLFMNYFETNPADAFGNMHVLYIIKISCIIDMVTRFFTGRVHEKSYEIVLDKRQIAREYLCGLFVFDFCTNLPLFFTLLLRLNPNDPKFHIVKLPTLCRICRLPAFVKYCQRVMSRLNVDDKYLEIFRLFAYWTFVVHWGACLHMAPGLIASKFRVDIATGAWYENENFQRKDLFGKYVICLFKGVKTLMGTGYLKELQPRQNFDQVYSSLLAIIGRIGLCITLALMYQFVRSVRSSLLRYDEMIMQLNKYAACHRLPPLTREKLKNNYDFAFCKHFFNEREILETISLSLRQEIMMHNTRPLVANSKFFENLPSTLVVRIISVLTVELFFEHDLVFNTGDVGASVYFITSGSVVFYSPGNKEVCHYSDGDYFGEMSFISDVDYRFCRAVALETTECYKLSRDDFQHLVASYPDLLQKVEQLALERMENITMIEELGNSSKNVGYTSINQRRYFSTPRD